MALQNQRFRLIGPHVLDGTPTSSEVIAGFKALLQSTVYHDASARTPGADSACTLVNAQDESGTETALIFRPATQTALRMHMILAMKADVSADSPKMIASGTKGNNILLMGTIKNVPETPTLQGWAHATSPIATADFTGYGKSLNLATKTPARLFLLEGREGVIGVIQNTDDTTYAFYIGATVDPFTTHTGAAETDGRLYGVNSTGLVLSSTFWNSSASASIFTGHSTTDTNNKLVVFAPGTANLWQLTPIIGTTIGTPGTNDMVSTDPATFARLPLYCRNNEAPNRLVGRFRGVGVFRDSQGLVALRDGATLRGFAVGANAGATQDAFFVDAAA